MNTKTETLGITSGDRPTRIQFEWETGSLILPSYDFVAARYGKETDDKIILEFRSCKIEISGNHLEILNRMIAADTVSSIRVSTGKERTGAKESLCYVTDIFYIDTDSDIPES